VIAGFASWHESHAVALKAVQSRPLLPVACALEAYALLTRLPAPHRVDPELVRDFFSATFAGAAIGMPAEEDGAALVSLLANLGIRGGATYDAVIALVCQRIGATLLTLDVRARSTYERIGVDVTYLG
jgi:hypothetical protein